MRCVQVGGKSTRVPLCKGLVDFGMIGFPLCKNHSSLHITSFSITSHPIVPATSSTSNLRPVMYKTKNAFHAKLLGYRYETSLNSGSHVQTFPCQRAENGVRQPSQKPTHDQCHATNQIPAPISTESRVMTHDLSNEERLLRLREDGVPWKEIARRISSDLGINYSQDQMSRRYKLLCVKLYPEEAFLAGVADAHYLCLEALYDNTAFRESTRVKSFALLRQVDPWLKPWPLDQTIWDTNSPSDAGTLTGGCAIIQLQPVRALAATCKQLVPDSRHPVTWKCDRCQHTHKADRWPLGYLLLLGTGLLTQVQWSNLITGKYIDR